MTAVSLFMIISGFAIIVVALVDVLWTTLGLGGGALMRRLTGAGWKMALRLHTGSQKSHRALSAVGVALVVSAFVTWTLSLFLGWLLVIASHPGALLTKQGSSASLWDRAYFVGSSMATLGRGDFSLDDPVWGMVAVGMGLSGLFILTLVITFLVPVAQASTKKRAVSAYLSMLGDSPAALVADACLDDTRDRLTQQLSSIAPDLALVEEQHVTYPFLHFIHTPMPHKSLAVQLARLDEALTIIDLGVRERGGFDNDTFRLLRDIVDEFLDSLLLLHPQDRRDPPPPSGLQELREKGLDVVSDTEFEDSLDKVKERRRRLWSSVYSDGWRWSDVLGHEAARTPDVA